MPEQTGVDKLAEAFAVQVGNSPSFAIIAILVVGGAVIVALLVFGRDLASILAHRFIPGLKEEKKKADEMRETMLAAVEETKCQFETLHGEHSIVKDSVNGVGEKVDVLNGRIERLDEKVDGNKTQADHATEDIARRLDRGSKEMGKMNHQIGVLTGRTERTTAP